MALRSPLKPMSNSELLSTLENISDIPTLPTVMAKIMKAAENPESGSMDLTKILKNDPSLSAKILKISNSAYYAQVMPVTTIDRAVMVIGFKEISSIATSAVLIKAFPGDSRIPKFNLSDLWKHTLGCAYGSKIIAEKIGYSGVEDAFMAGLLHDIGKVIISQFMAKYFQIIYFYVTSQTMTMFDVEKEILGETHCLVGEWLCKKWKLPENIRQVIAKHHTPDMSDLVFSEESIKLVNIINLSNQIVKILPIGSSGDSPKLAKISQVVTKNLDLGADDLKQIMAEISKTKSAIDNYF